MGQITKEFAESLLSRLKDGRHINTTLWEEEQLLNAWMALHGHMTWEGMPKLPYVNGEQDKKDAARYRYLRDTPPWKSDIAIVLSETVGDDISYICQEALDKMVDERACEGGST